MRTIRLLAVVGALVSVVPCAAQGDGVPECCVAEYNLAFSLERERDLPFGGVVGAELGRCPEAEGAALTLTLRPGESRRLYVSLVSRGGGTLEGYSVAVEVTGEIDVVFATSEATTYGAGWGDLPTSRVLPPQLNDGRRGFIAAEVFACPACPPALLPSTSSLVAFDVIALADGPVSTGRLRFVDDLVAAEGLPAVRNELTLGGRVVGVCSLEAAAVDVALQETVFRRGDANADGELDVADAIWLLNRLFAGGPESPCTDAGDTDDDGRLTITDAVAVVEHLFRGGSAPSAPYPDCGPDPTVDQLDCRTSTARCGPE